MLADDVAYGFEPLAAKRFNVDDLGSDVRHILDVCYPVICLITFFPHTLYQSGISNFHSFHIPYLCGRKSKSH